MKHTVRIAVVAAMVVASGAVVSSRVPARAVQGLESGYWWQGQPDGAPLKTDYLYQRTAGSSGFAGTWENASQQVNSAFELEVRPFESGGLSFSIPAEGVTKNIDFDGKDYPNLGANVSPGTTSSGRRVSDTTLEVTDKLHGKVTKTQQVKISPDRKSLIVTVRPVGQSKPNILVFERE